MRPKGWKLNPQWIAHYAAKEEAYNERQINYIKTEHDQAILRAQEELRKTMIKINYPPQLVPFQHRNP